MSLGWSISSICGTLVQSTWAWAMILLFKHSGERVTRIEDTSSGGKVTYLPAQQAFWRWCDNQICRWETVLLGAKVRAIISCFEVAKKSYASRGKGRRLYYSGNPTRSDCNITLQLTSHHKSSVVDSYTYILRTELWSEAVKTEPQSIYGSE